MYAVIVITAVRTVPKRDFSLVRGAAFRAVARVTLSSFWVSFVNCEPHRQTDFLFYFIFYFTSRRANLFTFFWLSFPFLSPWAGKSFSSTGKNHRFAWTKIQRNTHDLEKKWTMRWERPFILLHCTAPHCTNQAES